MVAHLLRGKLGVLLPLTAVMAPACDTPAPPPEPPWVAIDHRGTHQVDTSRIVARGAALEAWFGSDHVKPGEIPGQPGRTFIRSETLVRIDCAAKEVKDLQFELYDGEGHVVLRDRADPRYTIFGRHPFDGEVVPAFCERFGTPAR